MNRAILGAALAALSFPSSAQFSALQEPAFCGPDPRYRCVVHENGRPVRVVVPFTGHITLQLAEGGTVEPPAGSMLELEVDKAKQTKEWLVSYSDNVVFLAPLKDTLPVTNVTIPLRMPDKKLVLHELELSVRKGDASLWRCGGDGKAECMTEQQVREANKDNMIRIDYQYPSLAKQRQDEAKLVETRARAERAQARRAEEEARLARDILRQEVVSANRKYNFIARGDKETEPKGISHDGMSMLVEYDPNGRRPKPYILDVPEGEEGECKKENEARAPYDTHAPGVIQIHGVFTKLCFREGRYVTQVNLYGPKPEGTNPRTGTISPRVVRSIRPDNAPR